MLDPDQLTGDVSLRNLLDRIDDSVFVLDSAWRIVFANRAAAMLLAAEGVALDGMPIEQVLGANAWERMRPQVEHALVSGESTSFVARTSHPNRWFDHHAHPFEGGVIVVSRDITLVRDSVQMQEGLLTQSRRETHFSEALNRLNRTIVTEPDIDSVLNCVVREGMDALGVESAYIDVLHDGELVLRHAHGVAKDAYGRRMDPEAAPHLVRAADEREPVAIDDIRAREDIDPLYFERVGIRSVLATPLIVQGHILGFLSFAMHSQLHTWTGEEIRFVRRVSVRASLALQNLRSQEDLRASEKRFRSTFDLAPVGIANQALDGQWLRVNQRMCEIVGRDRQTLLELSFRDVTHPDDYAEDERLFNALVAGEIPSYAMEKRLVLPDGTPKWGQVSRSLVRTPEGSPDYVVTIIEDIDARHRAEAQLERARERERLLTEMLEDAAQPFAVGEVGGNLVMCNDAFAELTGYTVSELADRPSEWGARLMPPEWQQIALAGGGLEFAEGRPARFGMHYTRRDGSSVPVEVFAHLFTADTGRPLVYAFITDVTARVAADKSAQLSAALNEIDGELGKQLSSDTSLPFVLEMVASALGLRSASVLSAEAEGYRLIYGHQMPEELVGEVFTDAEAVYAARCIREDRTMVVDVLDANESPSCLAVRIGATSLAALPLRRGNSLHGAMVFCRDGGGPAFDDEELAFLTTVAAHASLAVENAQLYENEHRIAQTLQEALLKMPDSVPGVEFAHSYNSASAIAKVGGDFYDIFELNDGRVGIVVGDVSGKGLEAAALNARARASIRAELGVPSRLPADVLLRLNDVFSRETEDHVFFTVFVGVLDTRSGQLVYSSGGHTTAALIDIAGHIEQLPSTGPVVGAFEGLEFRNRHIRVDAGTVLFTYTDGLTEARRARELYGEDRLFGSLARHAGAPLPQLVENVVADTLRFATALNDDVAVLAVRRLG
ncbi:MAG TPA: PAS domain S-box protein [Coriobacteriia bacterium]|nr:PAS domain S-box protein [Coriobacteriia bacterium]